MVFTGYYLPGFKGGGPIRTIANMVENLGSEIQFSVVTADRDLGDVASYRDISPNQWLQLGDARIYYASPSIAWVHGLVAVIRQFDGHALHLNSFFSFRFSILPLLIWRALKADKPIIVGPRGEFSKGALALKSPKKRAFLLLAKALGLYRGVIWHASSSHEAEDIRRVIGDSARIRVAIDIACPPSELQLKQRNISSPLQVIFLSRISLMKNLLGVIDVLQRVKTAVVCDVYGPAEDEMYWDKCKESAKQLPAHVQFRYCGPLFPAKVPATLAQYDLFFLPTLGENFGHAIAEALGCGLPVLISDRTPWRDLSQKKLGWDIPLDQTDQFVAAIESCSRIPAADYDAWRQSIRAWALKNIGNEEAVEQNRQLFMNLDSANEY